MGFSPGVGPPGLVTWLHHYELLTLGTCCSACFLTFRVGGNIRIYLMGSLRRFNAIMIVKHLPTDLINVNYSNY